MPSDAPKGGRVATPPTATQATTTDLGRHYYEETARLVAEVADALGYAHQQGVIHRDVKPHNIIVGENGRPMVTDFGLARFLDQPAMTMSGEMMGTPVYMSPEQVAAQRVGIDQRTDIYSLGVTLYEMLTLRPPFEGGTREALLRQILMKDPVRLRRVSPRVPRDLETICLKAMEKDPDRRYQRAGEMAHDLRAFLEGYPIAARPVGASGRLWRRAMRRKTLTAAIAVAVVALVAGGLLGVEALRVGRRAEDAEALAEREGDRADAESRRADQVAAEKLEEHRQSLFAEAGSLTAAGEYGQARGPSAGEPGGRAAADDWVPPGGVVE